MVSFDVTFLFISMHSNLAQDVLRNRLEEAYVEAPCPLNIKHCMRLFEFCHKTYFIFAGEAYEQIKGTAMGSTISDLVSELVLQELANIVFAQHASVFWRR
ncbi:unnamed protein product [Dibothriocephalus latus]|uniref:Reverse transcriptase domain-containing protein n=1 Tax=Dibothriocephalus latus TaxID=60516 RepID=A0A3P6TDZ5_DIBLA|nr:unnamed protein product [Dibothriocephalus latus]